MYESYFGLKESPFNMTPDPRFLYQSHYHQEALSCLLYGVQHRKGFLELTGEIGAGKTTLCRTLFEKLGSMVHSAMVLNPKLSEFELLQAIVEDFGIEVRSKRRKAYFDALNRFLLEETQKGYNALVVIDESQLLSPRALEQVRLLTNLETPTTKLLQIILVGQPELKQLLARQDLIQLRQRIAIRYHLPALSRLDVAQYIRHRLSVAGSMEEIFTEEAFEKIYEMTGGVPRMINVLADRALLGAFAKETKVVDASLVGCAQEDLQGVHV